MCYLLVNTFFKSHFDAFSIQFWMVQEAHTVCICVCVTFNKIDKNLFDFLSKYKTMSGSNIVINRETHTKKMPAFHFENETENCYTPNERRGKKMVRKKTGDWATSDGS